VQVGVPEKWLGGIVVTYVGRVGFLSSVYGVELFLRRGAHVTGIGQSWSDK